MVRQKGSLVKRLIAALLILVSTSTAPGQEVVAEFDGYLDVVAEQFASSGIAIGDLVHGRISYPAQATPTESFGSWAIYDGILQELTISITPASGPAQVFSVSPGLVFVDNNENYFELAAAGTDVEGELGQGNVRGELAGSPVDTIFFDAYSSSRRPKVELPVDAFESFDDGSFF